MEFLLSFGLFKTYIHGKLRLGPLYHEIGSGRPIAEFPRIDPQFRQGLTAHVCEADNVRDLYILHVPTFHHTYTHILGTMHASFLGFTILRWSLSGETLDRRNPSSTIKGFQHYRTSASEKHRIFNNFSKICETKNHTHACDNTYTICRPLAVRDKICNVISCRRVETAIRRIQIFLIDKQYNHV
jgi:hypothetical protein